MIYFKQSIISLCCVSLLFYPEVNALFYLDINTCIVLVENRRKFEFIIYLNTFYPSLANQILSDMFLPKFLLLAIFGTN